MAVKKNCMRPEQNIYIFCNEIGPTQTKIMTKFVWQNSVSKCYLRIVFLKKDVQSWTGQILDRIINLKLTGTNEW